MNIIFWVQRCFFDIFRHSQQQMQNFRKLFVKGRFYIFIGCASLLQLERNYFIHHSKAYQELHKKAFEELKYIEPDIDHSALTLQTIPTADLNKLKIATKRQVVEVQSLDQQSGSTTVHTCGMLGLGAINYFIHPSIGVIFVTSYLLLNQVDFIKSLTVIKKGSEPWWQWKMKDIGFVMNSAFGFFTMIMLTRRGLAKLKERAISKALVATQNVNPEKNKGE